jgi:hypothetical protein
MTDLRGSAVAGLVAVIVLAGLVVPVAAQEDLAKVLVGTWEGEYQLRARDVKRTLVIESVKMDGDSGTAKGKWSGQGWTRSVNIPVKVSGKDVKLEWSVSAGTGVRVTLKNPTTLVGAGDFQTQRGTQQTALELTKVK